VLIPWKKSKKLTLKNYKISLLQIQCS